MQNADLKIQDAIQQNSYGQTQRLQQLAFGLMHIIQLHAANNVINTIDGGFSEANVTAEQLGQLKGECLFMRALAMFDMVRVYAQPYAAGRDNLGVPVVLVTELGYPARNTVGEVYDQITSDLETAEDLLAEDNPNSDEGLFATSWSAKALLAKVNLYMENWQDAADYAI